jgi:hypothetical protein
MTIPDVGRCLGSGKLPLGGTEEQEGSRASGVCGTCSGRFDLENGLLVEHEAAGDDEREHLAETAGDAPS